MRAYTSSLEAATSDAKVWCNRSAAHFSAGNHTAALEDARIARTGDPAYAKVRSRYIQLAGNAMECYALNALQGCADPAAVSA